MFLKLILFLAGGLLLFSFFDATSSRRSANASAFLYELCPDTLHIDSLHVSADTILYAESVIVIDSLVVDDDCEIQLIAPLVMIGKCAELSSSALVTISGRNGCEAEEGYAEHLRHRGIYINRFLTDGILGNVVKEDSLIQWCLAQHFNNIYLYNIGAALSSGFDEELAVFTYKANCHKLDVTYVSAGFGTSFTNIVEYYENFDQHPQGIVSEIEFWNGSGDYDTDYAPWLERLSELKSTVDPDLKRRFYIGKIKNPGSTPSIAIAEDLIANHDEIFLTNYHTNGYNLSTSASENSIRNKLSLLGEAAKNLDTVANIVILFNVRQDSPAPNIWSYFSEDNENHEFIEAYESFYDDYLNALDVTDKEHIKLKGFGIYRYTDAKEARIGTE